MRPARLRNPWLSRHTPARSLAPMWLRIGPLGSYRCPAAFRRLGGGDLHVPELMGISHIDLTVTDCDRAAAWWQDIVGLTLIHRVSNETYEARTLVHSSGFTITVVTHPRTTDLGPFDELRVGLDHLSFRVATEDELQRWATHLESKGVPHSGIVNIGYGPTLVFRDPDNTQLEFFVHPKMDELRLDAGD